MSEQSKFENEWKNAFDGAEMTPSVGVWNGVRAEVAAGQAQKQSKLAVYWRWMAAASVTLLLAASMIGFYYYQIMIDDYQVLAQQEQVLLREITLMEEEACEKENAHDLSGQQAAILTVPNEAKSETLAANYGVLDNNTDDIVNSNENEQVATNNQNKNNSSTKKSDDIYGQISQDIQNSLTEMIAIATSEVSEHTSEVDLAEISRSDTDHVSLLDRLETGSIAIVENNIRPEKVPDMMEIIKMQNGGSKDFRGMWAGLSLGGGSYESNTNRGRNQDSFSLANDNVEGLNPDGQTVQINTADLNRSNVETPAFSYSISADFGKQIGRRTYLLGGLEYSRYSSGATSNIVTTDNNNDAQVFLRYNNAASLDEKVLTNTEAYQVTNNFQYIAVPLKLGYKLLDRKIGITLASGVATNMFLKNTLKDQTGKSDDVVVTNGQASPYKPLNFNGLIGAELSYQWNDHYQLAIVPDYRFSIDGVTKKDAFVQSRPTTFFIGFRFKYILK